MNVPFLIAAAQSLDAALFCTPEKVQREEIENVLELLNTILQKNGVFLGTHFPRPRPGEPNQPPGDAAPGSTTKGPHAN